MEDQKVLQETADEIDKLIKSDPHIVEMLNDFYNFSMVDNTSEMLKDRFRGAKPDLEHETITSLNNNIRSTSKGIFYLKDYQLINDFVSIICDMMNKNNAIIEYLNANHDLTVDMKLYCRGYLFFPDAEIKAFTEKLGEKIERETASIKQLLECCKESEVSAP